jgi:hypothetical protein
MRSSFLLSRNLKYVQCSVQSQLGKQGGQPEISLCFLDRSLLA